MRKIKSEKVRLAIILVAAGAALYAIISVIDNIGLVWSSVVTAFNFVLRILAPVTAGFVIAFILNRPSKFFERLLKKIKFFAKRVRFAHGIGVLFSFIAFLGLLVLFVYLMVPGIVESVSGITGDLPSYAQKVDNALAGISQNPSVSQVLSFAGIDITKADSISSLLSQFWAEAAALLQGAAEYLLGFIVNTGLFLYNFVLGIFFAVYMLIYRDEILGQLRVLSKAVFHGFHYKLSFAIDIADDMFYRFFVGKGICSIAVGIIAFAACTIFGFKYSPLIALILALFNMIPTIGPFIGAVPALLLSLMTAPVYALYMLIIIVALQFIDGNILSPRILGNSMGINAFWIMFSIILMGALFGVFGMLIAAPLFGILRILLKNWIYHKQHGCLEAEAEATASKERFFTWTSKRSKKERKPASCSEKSDSSS